MSGPVVAALVWQAVAVLAAFAAFVLIVAVIVGLTGYVIDAWQNTEDR